MGDYQVNRPEQAAVERILQRSGNNAAGTIIRLAWFAGLLRDEIEKLTWSQVNFEERRIELADRTVPLEPELYDYLRALCGERNSCSEMVVLSDRDRQPLRPQSISRLARAALDEEGQCATRLVDLRHDYILRQLQCHDWQYVSRITGDEATALQVHFGEHMPQERISVRVSRKEPVAIDEFRLWKVLQAERDTPAGIALWLSWQMGLRLEEIVQLRWEQVDFALKQIRLPGRTLPMPVGVSRILEERRAAAPADGTVAASRTGRPVEKARLSRLARSALVRGGIDDVTLRDLRLDWELRAGGETRLMDEVQRRHSITRNEAAELLGVSPSTAYSRLKKLVERGRLTLVGTRYYLPAEVVPPERQPEAIVQYLEKEGFAYRQDIARLLHLEPRQCGPILKKLVHDGTLVLERQRYQIKEA